MTQNGKGGNMVVNYYSIRVAIIAFSLKEDQNFTMSWLQHD
jgi:hypothetical protein